MTTEQEEREKFHNWFMSGKSASYPTPDDISEYWFSRMKLREQEVREEINKKWIHEIKNIILSSEQDEAIGHLEDLLARNSITYICPTCLKESSARDGHYDCEPITNDNKE